jgi:hypothetical protein
MMLLGPIPFLILSINSLASASFPNGEKWGENSSLTVQIADCAVEFVADKIHYYNSMSKVTI